VSGGSGADAFFFGAGDGALRIADFAPGVDQLVLTASLGLTAAGALAQTHQEGANAVLDLVDGQSITFSGVTVASLAVADFLIA
jgi:Ca2+-binding RTX toxin-like protein